MHVSFTGAKPVYYELVAAAGMMRDDKQVSSAIPFDQFPSL